MIIVIKRDGVPIGYIGSDIMAIQLVERFRARADRLNESYKYTYGELDSAKWICQIYESRDTHYRRFAPQQCDLLTL